MRRGWLIVALCGCNRVLALDPTEPVPVDALPTSCPPIGVAPRFSGRFHQIEDRPCTDYSPNAATGTALALCGLGIEGGPLDMPLAPVGIAPIGSLINLKQPRLLPEGGIAYVDNQNFDLNNGDLFGEYHAVDATTWSYVGDSGIPHGTDLGALISVPTRAPHRHVMWTNGRDGSLHELVQQDTGSWTEVMTTAALGLPSIWDAASLTSDGLRMVVHVEGAPGAASTEYADRPTIDQPFNPAVRLEGVPDTITDQVMLDDCTRIYFSGVGRVFFVEQI
jgi:hypothetical protein